MPVSYFERDGIRFGVNVPDGYTPTDKELDGVFVQARRDIGRQKANVSLQNAAAGTGTPTTVNPRGQAVVAPEVQAQGIAPFLQQQAQAAQNADNARAQQLLHDTLAARDMGNLAYQQASLPPVPSSAAMLQRPAQIQAAHNAEAQQAQQMQAISTRQAQRDGTNLNQLVPGFDAALAHPDVYEHPGNSISSLFDYGVSKAANNPFYHGIERGSASVLNDPNAMAMLLAAPVVSPLLGAEAATALGRLFTLQQAGGLAQGVAHLDPSHDLAGQLGELVVPSIFTGLGAYSEGGRALDAYGNGLMRGLDADVSTDPHLQAMFGHGPDPVAPSGLTLNPNARPVDGLTLASRGEGPTSNLPYSPQSLLQYGPQMYEGAHPYGPTIATPEAPKSSGIPELLQQEAAPEPTAIRSARNNRATTPAEPPIPIEQANTLPATEPGAGVAQGVMPPHLALTPAEHAAAGPDIASVYHAIAADSAAGNADLAPSKAEVFEAARQVVAATKEKNVSQTPQETGTVPGAEPIPANTPPGAQALPTGTTGTATAAGQAGNRAGVGEAGNAEIPGSPLRNSAGEQEGAGSSVRRTAGGDNNATPVEPQRAGNINLDRLETSEEVKQAIRQAVRERGAEIEAARGGTITHEETVKAAADLGLTPAKLKARMPGATAAEHLAVRSLFVDSAEKLRQAQADYAADPTPEAQAVLQNAVSEHGVLLAHVAGQTADAGRALSAYKVLARALRGADDAAPTPAHVEEVFRPQEAGKAAPVDPTAPTYGSRNKLVTSADANAARGRIRASMSQANSGLDPALLGDLAKLGLFHLEAGLRQFPAWATQMKQEAPQASEGDLQTTWANLKAEAQKTQQVRAASGTFVDQLAGRIGRPGAQNFVEALRDEHGSTDLLDKLVTERPLTTEEGQRVAEAYLNNRRTPATAKQTTGAMQTVQQLAADARREARAATMRNKAPLSPSEAFTRSLTRSYGQAGAEGFLRAVGNDVVNKLVSGQELTDAERASVANAHLAARRPAAAQSQVDAGTQALRDIIKEAKQQAANPTPSAPTEPTPADTVKRLLLRNNKDAADRISAKLAGIDTHDMKALNRIVREETSVHDLQQAANVRRAGLLSSPKTIAKIAASHLVAMTADELSSYPAALTDAIVGRFTGQRTVHAPRIPDLLDAARQGVTTGVREGLTILRHGEEGAQERGVQPIGDSTADAFHSRILTNNPQLDALLNKVFDSHGAVYRPFRVAAMARSLQNQARVMATNEGLTGKAADARATALLNDPTPEMLLNGAVAVQESLMFNKNKTTDIIAAGKREAVPGLSAGADIVLPFPRISSNIVGRTLEHAFGIPLSVTRAAVMRGKGLPFTKAEQANFSKTFGRGSLGLAVIALGFKLAQNGQLTGFGDDKNHDGGRLQLGGRTYKISNEGPLPAALTIGATWHELKTAEHPAYRSAALETLAENPVLSAGEQIFNPHDPTGKAFVGGLAGSFVPSLFADVAAQLDSHSRKKPDATAYVKGRLPGLRNTLPEADYPTPDFPLLDPTGSRRAEATGTATEPHRDTSARRNRKPGHSRKLY